MEGRALIVGCRSDLCDLFLPFTSWCHSADIVINTALFQCCLLNVKTTKSNYSVTAEGNFTSSLVVFWATLRRSSWAGALLPSRSQWLENNTIDTFWWCVQMPTAYLITVGLAMTGPFLTAFAKRKQLRLGERVGEGGVDVIVIESDYPIISSNLLTESLSLSPSVYRASCFSSLSGFCLWWWLNLSFVSLLSLFFFFSPHFPCRSTCTSALVRKFSSCPWLTAVAISLSQTVYLPETPTAPGTARVGRVSASTSTAGETILMYMLHTFTPHIEKLPILVLEKSLTHVLQSGFCSP